MRQIFAQFTKADEASRMVYGTAAVEEPDYDDEIFDYESSKPYFEETAAEMSKASGGKNLMPVRAMHPAGHMHAAGHVTEMTFDDARKAVDIVAKVTDDQDWRKVLAGTYTGFSIEGKYIRRRPDTQRPHLRRYTAKPLAVSLADRPAIKNATFRLVKADGTADEALLVGNADYEEPEYEPQQVFTCRKVGHEHFSKSDARECIIKAASAPSQGGQEHADVVEDVQKHLTGDVGHDVRTEEEAGKPHDQAVAIALSEQDKVKKSLEEKMEEKELNELITKAVGTGNKEVLASIEDLKKAYEVRIAEVEDAVEEIAKTFAAIVASPEEEPPAVTKSVTAIKRKSDTVNKTAEDGDSNEPDDDEDDDPVQGDSRMAKKSAGFAASLRKTLSNPITIDERRIAAGRR